MRNSREFKSSTKIVLYNGLVRGILDYYSDYTTLSTYYEFRECKNGVCSISPTWKVQRYNFLSSRREACDALFLFKLLRNMIDCPDLLSLVRIYAAPRCPRKPFTPLCPPGGHTTRTVYGANSNYKWLQSCDRCSQREYKSIS